MTQEPHQNSLKMTLCRPVWIVRVPSMRAGSRRNMPPVHVACGWFTLVNTPPKIQGSQSHQHRNTVTGPNISPQHTRAIRGRGQMVLSSRSVQILAILSEGPWCQGLRCSAHGTSPGGWRAQLQMVVWVRESRDSWLHDIAVPLSCHCSRQIIPKGFGISASLSAVRTEIAAP